MGLPADLGLPGGLWLIALQPQFSCLFPSIGFQAQFCDLETCTADFPHLECLYHKSDKPNVFPREALRVHGIPGASHHEYRNSNDSDYNILPGQWQYQVPSFITSQFCLFLLPFLTFYLPPFSEGDQATSGRGGNQTRSEGEGNSGRFVFPLPWSCLLIWDTLFFASVLSCFLLVMPHKFIL